MKPVRIHNRCKSNRRLRIHEDCAEKRAFASYCIFLKRLPKMCWDQVLSGGQRFIRERPNSGLSILITTPKQSIKTKERGDVWRIAPIEQARGRTVMLHQ